MRLIAYRIKHGQFPETTTDIEIDQEYQFLEGDFGFKSIFDSGGWRYFPRQTRFKLRIPYAANNDPDYLYHDYTRGVPTLPQNTACIWVPDSHIRQIEVALETASANPKDHRFVKKWVIFDYDGTNIAGLLEDERQLMERYGTAYPIGPANMEE